MVAQQLIAEFKACSRLQYSGKLDISTCKGHSWSFYYRLGRIVWATGGNHPVRRWLRQMTQHCPQIVLDQIRWGSQDLGVDYWDYQRLTVLHTQQHISRDEVKAVVDNTIAELLFDLAQQANFNGIECDCTEDVILDAPMSFTSADISLKEMEEAWYTWSQINLASFSPDLAPILQRPEQLQGEVSPTVYHNFVALMTGKYTLRDLAVKMKQPVLHITRLLLPYVLRGIINLVEVADSPLEVRESKNNEVKEPKNNIVPKSVVANTPLIACIDDSLQVCQMLGHMINANNMRFVGIQDGIQALPILLEQKPDLIFLDLIMPVASGYEICAQLRRISVFANTPIVILTGSDGLVDRMRAKVVSSTDFMTKPISNDKVMAMVNKYLKIRSANSINAASASSFSNQLSLA